MILIFLTTKLKLHILSMQIFLYLEKKLPVKTAIEVFYKISLLITDYKE